MRVLLKFSQWYEVRHFSFELAECLETFEEVRKCID